MLLEKIVIATLMMFLCTLVHAVFMMVCNHVLDRRIAQFSSLKRPLYKAVLLWLVIVWMFLAIGIEAGLWAFVYVLNPSITEIPDAQSAFYFSMVTYTSLGYGDIVLTGNWRVLSAIQAANGLIIFGWTTALIFYYIQKIQKAE